VTITNRYDFVLLFDVTDGNPNGDPDANNQPRVDPETGHGIVTDVALKRRVRDYIALSQLAEDRLPRAGVEIYVKHRGVLANEQRRAYEAVGEGAGSDRPNLRAREWMCRQFWDVRSFGAVMTAGRAGTSKNSGDVYWNCGQVRGPVQLTFARSIDPITSIEHTITRTAQTNPSVDDERFAATGQMGRKHTVPYALYRAHGFVSPMLARDTGFSNEDLALLWESLVQMFEHDRSAARGMMSTVALIVFQHRTALGDTFAHRLFDRVEVKASASPPRSRRDYTISLDVTALSPHDGLLVCPALAAPLSLVAGSSGVD